MTSLKQCNERKESTNLMGLHRSNAEFEANAMNFPRQDALGRGGRIWNDMENERCFQGTATITLLKKGG